MRLIISESIKSLSATTSKNELARLKKALALRVKYESLVESGGSRFAPNKAKEKLKAWKAANPDFPRTSASSLLLKIKKLKISSSPEAKKKMQLQQKLNLRSWLLNSVHCLRIWITKKAIFMI